MWKFDAPRIAVLAAILVAAAGTAPNNSVMAETATIVDAKGRAVEITDISRIVSVGGSVTEILYALGLDDHIVAVDTTSLYPAAALADKPSVGYLRALSPEGLLSTEPTLIIAEDDAGPPEAISLLETASVPFLSVPEGSNAEGVAEKIRFIANAMGVSERGEALAQSVSDDLDLVNRAIEEGDNSHKALFVLSLSGGRILAAGEDTSAAAMIGMAGAENALTGFSGYKPVNDESVMEAAPEVIVMMARGDHAAGPKEVFSHPALSRTPAAENQRLVTMDGLYLLGFGPRVAHAVRDLAAALNPELELPELDERPWSANTREDVQQ